MQRFTAFLDWIGRGQLVQAFIQYLWSIIPLGWAAMTGWLGIQSGQPLMWVMVAASASAAFIFFAIFLFSVQRERYNPLNKLKINSTIFPHELAPPPPPNRANRRAGNTVIPVPARKVLKGQLGIEIINTASFPISLIPISVDSEVKGKQPPRTRLSRDPILIQAGGNFWVHDQPIELGGIECGGVIPGKIDMVVKYGNVGNEKYELTHRGTVEIFFEQSGFLKGVYFHPEALKVS